MADQDIARPEPISDLVKREVRLATLELGITQLGATIKEGTARSDLEHASIRLEVATRDKDLRADMDKRETAIRADMEKQNDERREETQWLYRWLMGVGTLLVINLLGTCVALYLRISGH